MLIVLAVAVVVFGTLSIAFSFLWSRNKMVAVAGVLSNGPWVWMLIL